MTSINISLSERLKSSAEGLISSGRYSTLSKLAQKAIERLIQIEDLDNILSDSKKAYKKGVAVTVSSKRDLSSYFAQLK